MSAPEYALRSESVRLAARTIEAAWLNHPSQHLADLGAQALEDAQLLQSPETAAEHERLRARVAELEAERHSTNDALAEITEAHRAPDAEQDQAVRDAIATAIEDRGKAFLPKHPVHPWVPVFAAIARDSGHTEAAVRQLRAQIAPAEYLFCGADLGRDEFPYTCYRRIGHDGPCGPDLDADTAAEQMPPVAPTDLTVFRAQHDSIPMGLYTTAAAARAHCEAEIQRDAPGAGMEWIHDEDDGAEELTVFGLESYGPTGFVVTALTVAAAYDAEADS